MISAETKVRDYAARHPKALRVFERYGIDYCCGGGDPLTKAAAEKGVDLQELERELEAALATPREDNEEEQDWTVVDLTTLSGFILKKHHAFMKEELPRVGHLLETVVRVHGPNHGDVLLPLQQQWQALRSELEAHLEKEERVLFPMINLLEAQGTEAIAAHCGGIGSPIRVMMIEHDNAGEALAEMRRITHEYTLPDDACTTFAALYDGLQAIEDDLHHHIHLENNILFPRTVKLSQQGEPEDL